MAAAQVTYTCCEARDVDTLYRPGQTLTVHWIVSGSDQPGATQPHVELAARLIGPYASVDTLKAATDDQTPSEAVTFAAAPVRPSGTPDERPVSTIVIGPEAKPGYYNLITSVTGEGSTVSGASIIHVVPTT
ncbi:hypothetical protein [Dactylosporangium sp. NPDC048998]|uniref:hypothetical protein n=1 Tax=Dactylosporangium sp. NPDC048998 TaxID=3363976 RepID=UPI003718E8BA